MWSDGAEATPEHARRATPPPGPDPCLAPYLGAEGDAAAASALDGLLDQASRMVRPVIRGQLSMRARRSAEQDEDDVHAGCLLRLAEHLRACRSADPPPPIADFGRYVAATARNACHALLRRRAPERSRLRNKVRYVLAHDAALALWESAAFVTLCGAAAARGASADEGARRRLEEMGRTLARPAAGPAGFRRLVRTLLRECGGPCRLNDLVDAVAAVLGIEDEPAKDLAAAADPLPSAEESLERRDYLTHLWAEIRDLPRAQRAALLLNLRDADGQGVLALLPVTGTASRSDIASALELPGERLDAVWSTLPRDDGWIASELGVTRRQVINLRKCARERLARRMRRRT
jgi:hypothetical protein